MNIEKLNERSPEELANIQKERTISDAELLKGGAEFVLNEDSGQQIEVTRAQIKGLEREHYDKMTYDDLSHGEAYLVDSYLVLRKIREIMSRAKMDYDSKFDMEKALEVLVVELDSLSQEIKDQKTRGLRDLHRITQQEFEKGNQDNPPSN